MKNYYYILLLFLTLSVGCDKDDICIEELTPNLIIRFYDYDNTNELKKVDLDSVYAKDMVAVDNYTSISIDSIAIPLDLNSDFTIYNLSSNNEVNQLEFTYVREEIYLSRSCGYKFNFEEFATTQNSLTWIKDIQIITNLINNEEAAHIHIFH